MTRILRSAWDDPNAGWSEHDLQVAIVNMLAKLEAAGRLTYAADMNAAPRSKRTGARLKAAGMRAGEPDLRIYLPSGRLLLVELKTDRGRLSLAQRARRDALVRYGHEHEVIKAATPAEAVTQLQRALARRGVIVHDRKQ